MLTWTKELAGNEGGEKYYFGIKLSLYISCVFVFCLAMILFVLLDYISIFVSPFMCCFSFCLSDLQL